MSESITVTTSVLTNPSMDQFLVDGVKCVKAVIVRKKGRYGKPRPVWQGKPWEACLMGFQLGIVIKQDVTWTVLLTRQDGREFIVSYDDLLHCHKEGRTAHPAN